MINVDSTTHTCAHLQHYQSLAPVCLRARQVCLMHQWSDCSPFFTPSSSRFQALIIISNNLLTTCLHRVGLISCKHTSVHIHTHLHVLTLINKSLNERFKIKSGQETSKKRLNIQIRGTHTYGTLITCKSCRYICANDKHLVLICIFMRPISLIG